MKKAKKNANDRALLVQVRELRVALFGLNGRGGAIGHIEERLHELNRKVERLQQFRESYADHLAMLLSRLNKLSARVGEISGARPFKPLAKIEDREHNLRVEEQEE